MPAKVRFSMICSKTFGDLSGNDLLERHCSTCALDVVHLDRLSDSARETILATAARAEMRFCGSTERLEIEASPACESEAFLRKMGPTTGAAIPPEQEAARNEQRRLEQIPVLEAQTKIREILTGERARLGIRQGESSWVDRIVRRITKRR